MESDQKRKCWSTLSGGSISNASSASAVRFMEKRYFPIIIMRFYKFDDKQCFSRYLKSNPNLTRCDFATVSREYTNEK